MFDINIKRGS